MDFGTGEKGYGSTVIADKNSAHTKYNTIASTIVLIGLNSGERIL